MNEEAAESWRVWKNIPLYGSGVFLVVGHKKKSQLRFNVWAFVGMPGHNYRSHTHTHTPAPAAREWKREISQISKTS